MEPRGIRNCNPGNIRITKDKWKGLREVQTDKEFFQFVSMPYGYRALLKTLKNYRRRSGCETIAEFIRRWAPPVENNTVSYIRYVCNRLGVSPDWVPKIEDKDTMIAVAAAISCYENGVEPDMEEIYEGWQLLYDE